MTRKPTTVERRCAGQTGDVTAHADQRAHVCARCGCVWLDYDAGRDAHVAVFGHAAQMPEQQDTGDGSPAGNADGAGAPVSEATT